MPISIDMAPLLALPEDERRAIVEALLESLPDDEVAQTPELTDAQRAELERRVAYADAHPEDFKPWDQVYAATLARLKR